MSLYTQDDVVMGTLTVRENISFSAALRLPSVNSKRDRRQKVDLVIKELGLTHVADNKVSDIYFIFFLLCLLTTLVISTILSIAAYLCQLVNPLYP